MFNYDYRYSKLNTYIILCYKNKHEYEKDDDIKDVSKYTEITKQLRLFLKKSKCHVLLLNTSDQQLNKQVSSILSFIHENRHI